VDGTSSCPPSRARKKELSVFRNSSIVASPIGFAPGQRVHKKLRPVHRSREHKIFARSLIRQSLVKKYRPPRPSARFKVSVRHSSRAFGSAARTASATAPLRARLLVGNHALVPRSVIFKREMDRRHRTAQYLSGPFQGPLAGGHFARGETAQASPEEPSRKWKVKKG